MVYPRDHLKPEPAPKVVIQFQDRTLPRFTQGAVKATYAGPLSLWHGKTALVQPLVAAQFDDLGQYTAHGWHLFNQSDFIAKKDTPLFKAFANAVVARENCIKRNNEKWRDIWACKIEDFLKDEMPSGSGFDVGTRIDLDASGEDKLVFLTSFHHMDEHGSYVCWTEHQVIVRPSLLHEFTLRITGPDRGGIKDHIHEAFSNALFKLVESV